MNIKSSSMGALLVVMAFAGAADAGQITDMQLYDGTSQAPIVTITYTNPDGTGHNTTETQYADPQVSGGTTAPIYYCIDLWHDNSSLVDLHDHAGPRRSHTRQPAPSRTSTTGSPGW